MNRSIYTFCAIVLSVIMLFSCKEDDVDEALLPKLTAEVSELELGNVIFSAERTDTTKVSLFGFYYSTQNKSSLKNWTFVEAKGNSKSFSTTLLSLELGKTYYVKAYAQNQFGEGFSNTVEYKTLGYRYESYTDERDGNMYRTVKIGNQIWMADNFAYLPGINVKTSVAANKLKYYVYPGDTKDVEVARQSEYYREYGVLYNWMTAAECAPAGWRLPTKADWNTMLEYVAKDNNLSNADSVVWSEVGKLLKMADWTSGISRYGLDVTAAPSLEYTGEMFAAEDKAGFWSSTEATAFAGSAISFEKSSDDAVWKEENKASAFPVRLVKDLK